ncbi:MAG: trypsin-like peptidase domain-containing protein [Clostridia bacterium]|nr:trypsin-like peptidase domain-containing protein [Clostridia bacterium]
MENDNNMDFNNEEQNLWNEQNSDEGYTVTPNGGFYNRNKEEIIQDEIMENNNTSYSEADNQGNRFNSNFSHYNQFYEPPKRQVKPKKKYGAGVVVLASVLAAFIGLFGGLFAVGVYSDNNKTVDLSEKTEVKNVNINVDETAPSVVAAVAEKVSPSVVGVRTTTSVINFFGGSSEAMGEGSGVIYSQDGYIITNYHVIESALQYSSSKIEIYLDTNSSDSYEASVVGYNISTDLAVLKINVTGLMPAEIGKSDDLKVGQFVVTIGNPGGLEFMKSVTYGVISGLNRVVSTDSNVELIQTDAAINPGNSGGALLNTSGQLIGINSSKIVSEEYEGMGFAIPIDTVVKVCNDIISKQNSPDPYVGITVSEKYTAEVLNFYGYPTGAVVLSVADASPANEAGIKKGDIITEYNGKEITQYKLLNQLIEESNPGDKVTVKLYRSGRYYTTKLTVGSNNEQ